MVSVNQTPGPAHKAGMTHLLLAATIAISNFKFKPATLTVTPGFALKAA